MTTPDSSAATDLAVPDLPAERPAARRRGMVVTVAAFLMMLLVLREDLLMVLDRPSGPRAVGLVGLVGVAVLFAGVVIRMPWRRPRPSPSVAGAVLGAQVLFVVLACLGSGENGLVGAAFVGMTAIFLLPRAAAGWIVACYVATVVFLPRTVPGWQPVDASAVTGVLGGLAAYGMVTGAERRRRRERAQEDAEQLAAFRERERIVRDMHDVLGHALTVISVKAELAARLHDASGRTDGAAPDSADARAAAELADVQSLARTALADVRGLIAEERRPNLTRELTTARAALDAAGIDVHLPDAVDTLPADRSELFAWVLREGSTNVLRHSEARHVHVELTADTLVIDDDGAGPPPSGRTAGPLEEPTTPAPPPSPSPGHGLTGLDARARAAGAHLTAGPRPGGGFRLAVTYRTAEDPT